LLYILTKVIQIETGRGQPSAFVPYIHFTTVSSELFETEQAWRFITHTEAKPDVQLTIRLQL